MIQINFLKLHSDAIPFKYIRKNDACMDIYAFENIYLQPQWTKVIKTNIAVELPKGYEGRVTGRSGLSSKGILVHQGIIDEEYRGSIGVIMSNLDVNSYSIKRGDRIAQFSIHPVYRIELNEVYGLSETERDINGYGSSGI